MELMVKADHRTCDASTWIDTRSDQRLKEQVLPGILRLARILRILETLQSGKVYSSQELAELCGVSRRTVFRDIAALQQAGIHISLDQSRQGYFVPHRLAFPPSEISASEALALLLICQNLGGTKQGIPFLDAARSAAWKVCQNMPPKIREFVGSVVEVVSVSLDPHDALMEAQPKYQLVLQALIERRQVRINYDAGPPEGLICTALDTYRVIFLSRSWYVIGRSSLHREVRVFHLGRIQRSELLDDTYQIPPRFSLERFFGNAWHLIREPQSSEVIIRFDQRVARDVAEIRWHKTQRTNFLPDGRLEFCVTVDGLEEIVWWILGYGDRAEVVAPKALRERIRIHSENMTHIYARPCEC